MCKAGLHKIDTDGPVGAVCLVCPDGTYSEAGTATSLETCTPCPPGSWSAAPARSEAQCDSTCFLFVQKPVREVIKQQLQSYSLNLQTTEIGDFIGLFVRDFDILIL